MNPNLLKQLAIIVKQGSLSAACEQLHVTQPTLTRSIKQLEFKVGAPVLTRSRYGVTPTEIGLRLSVIGERILAESEHGDEIIRQFHSGYKSEFVIGIDPLWEFATCQPMAEFFLAEKRFAFHFKTGSAAAQIQLLQQGMLDYLIGPAYLTVAQGTLQRQVLFRDRSAIFAGKKSKLRGSKQAIDSALLAKQNWMIAGVHAGFLDSSTDITDVKAASVAFTGSIRSILHLLNCSDMLVQLPARLTLMTGEVELDQMLTGEDHYCSRKDIALWSRLENSERPDIIKVNELITEFVANLDQNTPTFGLDI